MNGCSCFISESSIPFLDLYLSTLITVRPILLTARTSYHTVNFSVFEGFLRKIMTLWPNPKRWDHSLRGDDIHALSLPPAENQANGFGVKEHSGTLNDMNKRPKKVPLVLTYHPKNQEVTKTLLKNFHILNDDSSTKDTFNSKPLCVYRRNTSLRYILITAPSLLELILP